MRRFMLWLCLITALALPRAASAQFMSSLTVSALSGGTCTVSSTSCALFKIPKDAVSVTFQTSGTFSLTVTAEATSAEQVTSSTVWAAVQLQNLADGSAATTITAAGQFASRNPGHTHIRLRVTTFVSGSMVIVATRGAGVPLSAGGTPGAGDIEGVTAGAGLTGGGVSGTVTVDVGGSSSITVNADSIQVATAGVTLAMMANLAQDQFIGRVTASTGVPETATITAAARTVLDDTTVAAMVDTLGGAAATGSGGLVRTAGPTLSSVILNGSVTFQDGVRQTFNPDGTAAGLNVGSQAGDPSTPTNGDLWYDSTANELTARINGANVALGAGGGGSVATDVIWDAAGDLAVGSGANTAVRLARGSALQVLQVNSGGTNIEWGTLPTIPLVDTTSIVEGSADATKEIRFEVDGLTTATVRVITAPDANTTLPIISQVLTFSGPTAARTYTLADANTTLVGHDTTNTLTNKTIDVEATGNVITTTHEVTFPVAVCQNATATLGGNAATTLSPTAVCESTAAASGDPAAGFATFPTGGADTEWHQYWGRVPTGFTGNFDAIIHWRAISTTANDVVWRVAVGCVAAGEALTAISFNTTTFAADTNLGTTLQLNDTATTTLTTTGCAAGEQMYFKVLRDTDTAGDTLDQDVQFQAITFIYRRAQ